DLAGGVARDKADHQLVGERPGLAAEVANAVDLEPDFLFYLAGDGFLERFARLDEAREHAEEAIREGPIAGEQELVRAPPNEHDDGWTESREAEQSAARAQLGALGRRMDGRLAAPTAEPMRLIPDQDLSGATGDCVVLIRESTVECPQAFEGCAS